MKGSGQSHQVVAVLLDRSVFLCWCMLILFIFSVELEYADRGISHHTDSLS